MNKKIGVVDIVAWWPTELNPNAAPFIREHILSTSKVCEHIVVHVSFEKKPFQFVPKFIFKETNEAIRVHQWKVVFGIRRLGLHDLLIKRCFQKAIEHLRVHHEYEPDIFHFHVRSHITRIALELLCTGETPIIISEHFSYYHRGLLELPLKDQKAERKAIETQFNAETVKEILPVSQDMKARLQNEFNIKRKLTVIPNIAHESFFEPLNTPRKSHHFVACSVWTEPKDPMVMLSAIHALKTQLNDSFHLDIIGDGELIPVLKSYCYEHLKEVSITFHGYKTKPFISEKLRGAIGLLHPTKAENLPTIIIESLVCGCPVLSMNVNGIPELIDNENGITVQANDVQAFAQGIMQLSENAFNYEEIANEAREKFSSRAIGDKIFNIYNNILKP